MTTYFSFRKLITPYFVRTIYSIGFAALTAAGIGWIVWAGMRFNAASLPGRLAIYYIAIGAGVLLIGNLAWRLICEFWLLLFDMHGLLASIENEMRGGKILQPSTRAVTEEPKPDSLRPERSSARLSPSRSVLGLS